MSDTRKPGYEKGQNRPNQQQGGKGYSNPSKPNQKEDSEKKY